MTTEAVTQGLVLTGTPKVPDGHELLQAASSTGLSMDDPLKIALLCVSLLIVIVISGTILYCLIKKGKCTCCNRKLLPEATSINDEEKVIYPRITATSVKDTGSGSPTRHSKQLPDSKAVVMEMSRFDGERDTPEENNAHTLNIGSNVYDTNDGSMHPMNEHGQTAEHRQPFSTDAPEPINGAVSVLGAGTGNLRTASRAPAKVVERLPVECGLPASDHLIKKHRSNREWIRVYDHDDPRLQDDKYKVIYTKGPERRRKYYIRLRDEKVRKRRKRSKSSSSSSSSSCSSSSDTTRSKPSNDDKKSKTDPKNPPGPEENLQPPATDRVLPRPHSYLYNLYNYNTPVCVRHHPCASSAFSQHITRGYCGYCCNSSQYAGHDGTTSMLIKIGKSKKRVKVDGTTIQLK